MSQEPVEEVDGEDRKRDKVAEFLKKNLTKGELALKRAAGLGQQPNVVPVTEPRVDGEPRPVEVAWHPVGGFAGKWFAEDTGLGKMITDRINSYPDPTQHWAVLDENFHVIYTNEKVTREGWRTFKVGQTRFNDDAVRRAGESVIQSIRNRQPRYNLITNNCQTYALELLDAIKVSGSKEFGTTLAVYDRLFGEGAVKDLFIQEQPPPAQIEGMPPPPQRTDTVSLAQQVMNDNTNQLDTKQEMDRLDMQRDGTQSPDYVNDSASGSREILDDGDPKKKKKKKKKTNSFLSRFMPGKSSD
ncbi:hypothetical protein BN1708_009878 [Verticillium longisporum]|uniref:PPPDE domain-containing protein n=1 Tax=Verticillium longisporum TaxID=100787 RepID=A0A0G4KLU8_VERLO|nr:hypothetical protein BN1708_009878 [Verticillium longisporum]